MCVLMYVCVCVCVDVCVCVSVSSCWGSSSSGSISRVGEPCWCLVYIFMYGDVFALDSDRKLDTYKSTSPPSHIYIHPQTQTQARDPLRRGRFTGPGAQALPQHAAAAAAAGGQAVVAGGAGGGGGRDWGGGGGLRVWFCGSGGLECRRWGK
jgi:hypothetical protein